MLARTWRDIGLGAMFATDSLSPVVRARHQGVRLQAYIALGRAHALGNIHANATIASVVA